MAREGGQHQKTTRRSTEEEQTPEPDAAGGAADRKERLDDDVDAILDEIDEVLESNAEEFVRGFVQKGGQ